MKVIMEFNLPDDDSNYIAASKGLDLYFALLDISEFVRSMYKYDYKHDADTIDYVRERFWDILGERNITLEELD